MRTQTKKRHMTHGQQKQAKVEAGITYGQTNDFKTY